MEYRVDDRSLSGETFLDFVQQVWPGAYNLEQTRAALSKTMNFTAWDGGQLAGCLRVLTDGCFFGTITELLVLPAYQRQGIGSRLLRLAAAHTPTLLYFGAQPGAEAFYEKNGCTVLYGKTAVKLDKENQQVLLDVLSDRAQERRRFIKKQKSRP